MTHNFNDTEVVNQNCRSRGWCLTINNWSERELDTFKTLTGVKYSIFGRETGESGTPHLQCYVYFSSARTFRSLKKTFPRARLARARGNHIHNQKYCSKDGDFQEFGELPAQGERTDIVTCVQEIMEGKDVDDFVTENPAIYHQYGRTLEKAADLALRKRPWDYTMPKVTWYYGPTGVGKSHLAFKDYNPDTHYVWRKDAGWQDAYKCQPNVIINEFRGDLIPYASLLEMTDKWPNFVRRRGKEPMPFCSKNIIITSSLPPNEIYVNLALNDKLDQLYRRIEVIEIPLKTDTEVLRG